MWNEDSDTGSDAMVRLPRNNRGTVPEASCLHAVTPRGVYLDMRRPGIAARVARRLYALHFRVAQAHRYDSIDLATVHGLRLLVVPGVFHPEFFFATEFFLSCLDGVPVKGLRALDMGCGSGALAVALAKRGADVVAVDINSEAVRCTRANVLLHGLEGRVHVEEGDLFASLADREFAFDLMVFNPPFYARSPRSMPDRAWAAGPRCDTVVRFCRDAPGYLAAGGELLLMGSTEAPYTPMLRRMPGFSVRQLAQRELVSERLMLFALRADRQLQP